MRFVSLWITYLRTYDRHVCTPLHALVVRHQPSVTFLKILRGNYDHGTVCDWGPRGTSCGVGTQGREAQLEDFDQRLYRNHCWWTELAIVTCHARVTSSWNRTNEITGLSVPMRRTVHTDRQSPAPHCFICVFLYSFFRQDHSTAPLGPPWLRTCLSACLSRGSFNLVQQLASYC